MEKFKQVLVIISTIIVIAVNFLATAGYIGGVTPEVISDKYQTFLTPAGYAFSIWGWIYLGLIGAKLLYLVGRYNVLTIYGVSAAPGECQCHG